MRASPARGQLWAFVYPALRRSFEPIILVASSDGANEIELLTLRHEVAMLRRQVKRQTLRPADRAFLGLMSRLLRHYDRHRSHQGLSQQIPASQSSADPVPPTSTHHPQLDQLRRRDRLGGLIHEYERAA